MDEKVRLTVLLRSAMIHCTLETKLCTKDLKIMHHEHYLLLKIIAFLIVNIGDIKWAVVQIFVY